MQPLSFTSAVAEQDIALPIAINRIGFRLGTSVALAQGTVLTIKGFRDAQNQVVNVLLGNNQVATGASSGVVPVRVLFGSPSSSGL